MVLIRRRSSLRQIRRTCPFLTISCVVQHRTNIAGTCHGRIDKLVCPVRGRDQFRVMQFDPHLVSGHDVCHIHRKHICPFLGHHGSALALALCLLKFLFGLFLLLNDRRHGLVSDLHLHAVNRDLR